MDVGRSPRHKDLGHHHAFGYELRGRHEATSQQNHSDEAPWQLKGTNITCDVSHKKGDHVISYINATPCCILHIDVGRSPRHKDLGQDHAFGLGCVCSSYAFKPAHSLCQTTSHEHICMPKQNATMLAATQAAKDKTQKKIKGYAYLERGSP